MKKLALVVLIFCNLLGISHAAQITFSEPIQNSIQVGTRDYPFLETTDGKYRAVAYHYRSAENEVPWQPGGFTILNGTYDTPSVFSSWAWWDWKDFQGFYIERTDNGLFDLVSMEIVADLATSGTGGVAATADIDPGPPFETAPWKVYRVDGLSNVTTQGPQRKTIYFQNDFKNVSRVYLDGGYPFFIGDNTYGKGALWDNIKLEDAQISDIDNDGIPDQSDNCPNTPNPDQADADNDSIGDVCDLDDDNDNIDDVYDNCPFIPNSDQEDNDSDGLGDVCDDDDDNDGIADSDDNCPLFANADQNDLDGDNIGDICDIDIDGDGVENDYDNCPVTSNIGQDDTDYDGDGDACDDDDDNDNIDDTYDNCPLVYNPYQEDLDGNGTGDVCDDDIDGDGIENDYDNCPYIANSGQNDFDLDGIGDVCDQDADDDGVENDKDLCPETPLGEVVDPETGCSIDQLCPCDGPRGTDVLWRNHGKYVSCVAKAAESFVNEGLFIDFDKEFIVSSAAESFCGKK